jgi:chromosome segregation protein
MHLRSISMKGFKSFPNRTKLSSARGVSVVVGPERVGQVEHHGRVLWALGEQSPLAVRGQSMKDVIFAGAHGVQGSNAAEVEVVIDNHDGALDLDFSEISIVRRLDRDGEGEYRLNGARCRLGRRGRGALRLGARQGDALGRVAGQGRADRAVAPARAAADDRGGGRAREAPQAPPPRAAEAGADRGEPRRARSTWSARRARGLRPLKRQAEAAELHERLERQTLEAR